MVYNILAVCSVENGKIVAESVYGQGSTFTIQVDQKIVPKTIEDFEQEEKLSDTVGFEASNSKIIVVDDNKINLKVAERLLRDYKAEITLLPSGYDCINKVLENNTFGLILMDDMMPKMTGVETLQNLKKIMGFKTPVVALTANAISGMKEQYLAAGFDDYLPKPIDRKQLDAVLRKYLTPTGDSEKVIVRSTKPAVCVISNDIFNYYIEEEEVVFPCYVSNEAHMLAEKLDIVGDVVPTLDKKQEESHFNNVEFLKANGVDVDHGLELLGDMDMYNMTVAGFLDEQIRRVPELGKYKKAGDMANYAILVHSMKSDSKYLGLMKLADLAYQHEMASKSNDINFVNDKYDDLIDEVNITYNILSEYIGNKE